MEFPSLNLPSLVLHQDEEEATEILHELCRLRPQNRKQVKKLVSYLSTAMLKGGLPVFFSTFLIIYPRYASTRQLVDWIMDRRVTMSKLRGAQASWVGAGNALLLSKALCSHSLLSGQSVV